MSSFQKGERVFIDRTIPATFVRYVEQAAVIRIGEDTRVINILSISREEG